MGVCRRDASVFQKGKKRALFVVYGVAAEEGDGKASRQKKKKKTLKTFT